MKTAEISQYFGRFVKLAESPRAFSLVEITMAVGLMSFCLVALMGLMPVALMQERKSQEKQRAGLVLTAVAADIKSKLASGDRTPRFGIIIPSIGGSASEGRVYLSAEMEMASSEAERRFEVLYKIIPPKIPYGAYHISATVRSYLSPNVGNRADIECVDVVFTREKR